MRTMQQSAMSYLKSDSYCRVTALWPFILPLIVLHHWQFASASTKVTQTNQLYAFVSTVRHSFCYRKVRGLKPSSPALYMGRKITIRIVGRKQGGEEWLEDACDMYLKRLKPTGFEVCTEWYKNDAALIKVQTETMESSLTKYIPIVLLDPKGIRCTSELFTEYVYDWLEEGGSRLVIVIGGAEGLPNEMKDGLSNSNSISLKKRNPILLSLSDLTFTHQFTRLVLIEQIYRATEIRKGSGYHK